MDQLAAKPETDAEKLYDAAFAVISERCFNHAFEVLGIPVRESEGGEFTNREVLATVDTLFDFRWAEEVVHVAGDVNTKGFAVFTSHREAGKALAERKDALTRVHETPGGMASLVTAGKNGDISLFDRTEAIVRVRCGTCNGGGGFRCDGCFGTGSVSCSDCWSTGKKRCHYCNGDYTRCAFGCYQGYRDCGTCLGKTRVNCGGCGGCGRRTCGGCSGAGVTCDLYNGSYGVRINHAITVMRGKYPEMRPEIEEKVERWVRRGMKGRVGAKGLFKPYSSIEKATPETRGDRQYTLPYHVTFPFTYGSFRFGGTDGEIQYVVLDEPYLRFSAFLDPDANKIVDIAWKAGSLPSAVVKDLRAAGHTRIADLVADGDYGAIASRVSAMTNGAVSTKVLDRLETAVKKRKIDFSRKARLSAWKLPVMAAVAVWMAAEHFAVFDYYLRAVYLDESLAALIASLAFALVVMKVSSVEARAAIRKETGTVSGGQLGPTAWVLGIGAGLAFYARCLGMF